MIKTKTKHKNKYVHIGFGLLDHMKLIKIIEPT
uniref:Uncharacterized protein n=1 Tax=Podoviridae sp. ct2m58 TaxID=2827721 RepID=A0A8S5TMD5_9CAUD|nr:MAG TPA: hypothetical protein [Podoviridae sp. ct2m58]